MNCKNCKEQITDFGGVWMHVGEPLTDAIRCRVNATPEFQTPKEDNLACPHNVSYYYWCPICDGGYECG